MEGKQGSSESLASPGWCQLGQRHRPLEEGLLLALTEIRDLRLREVKSVTQVTDLNPDTPTAQPGDLLPVNQGQTALSR